MRSRMHSLESSKDLIDVVAAWVVYIDTRDTKGEVVQIIDSIWYSRKSARRRRNRINTHPDDYPNQVAWIEVEDRHLGNELYTRRNSQAKLTWENVAEIRARRTQGEKIPVLAAEFNVTQKTIRRVINGETWNDGS